MHERGEQQLHPAAPGSSRPAGAPRPAAALLRPAARRLRAHVTWTLAATLLGGTLLRAALAPVPGYAFDLRVMTEWGSRLASHPLSEFYASPELVDHLPGDLWLLAAVSRLFTRLVGPVADHPESFHLALKAVPIAADALVALALFLLACALRGPAAGLLAAALFALNPVAVFVSAVWGQWDSVSALVALVAVGFFLAPVRPLAFPVLTYAALIKPQFAVLAPLLALAWALEVVRDVRRARRAGARARRSLLGAAAGLLAAAAGSYAVAVLALLPFGVSVPPFERDHSLVERLDYAFEVWPFVSMYAFNLWTTAGEASRQAVRPDSEYILGASYRMAGIALFSVAYVLAAATLTLWRARAALPWALSLALLALFMLTTRQHERYAFAALTFAALLAALRPVLLPWLLALCAAVFVNVWYAFALAQPVAGRDVLLAAEWLPPAVSRVALALFLVLAAWGIWQARLDRGRTESPTIARGT